MRKGFTSILSGAIVIAGAAIAAAQQTPEEIPDFVQKIMSHEWYLEQGRLWKEEIDANRSNAHAWYSCYKAGRYAVFTDTASRSGGLGKLEGLIDDMEKAIPESFEYHYCRWWNGGNDPSRFPHLQRAFEIRPDYAMLAEEFIVYYEMHGDRGKMAEFNRKWYQVKELPRSVLNFQYNVLMSLEENAILVTAGDMDTYPVWMLQQVKGIRPDVTVLNTSLMSDPDYRRMMMAQLKLEGDTDAATGAEFWKSVVDHGPSRPLYFALTVPPEYIEPLQDNLYTVGLANRYSPKRFDNIALLKRNWDRFRLDYLTLDFYDEEYQFNDGHLQMLNLNYVTPAVLLYEHYMLAGEREKAEQFRELAMRLAREGGREKEVREYFSGLTGGNADLKEGADHAASVEVKEDMAFGDAIRVFPNPTYSGLTVQLPEAVDAEIRMADAEGTIVRTLNGRGPEIRVDIAGLPAGAYFLNIRTSRGTFTRNVQVVR